METDLNGITVNEGTTAEFYLGGVPGEEHARVGGWLNVGEGSRTSGNAQLWFTNVVSRVGAVAEAILYVFGGPYIKITTDCIELNGPVKLPIEGESGMATTLTVKRVDGELVLDISE